jgi:Kef-type K+ transport system membrane component KefB
MAFIAVGIIIGLPGTGLASINHEVELFAEMGIALLLFVVGLKLNPREIREVGPVALIAGLGQIFITGLISFGLGLTLGLTFRAAFYVGMALTFSSTIIVVKLLSDRKEIDALHGKIALAILIIQDICVILLMIILTAFASNQVQSGLIQSVVLMLVKGGGFLLFLVLVTRYILPTLLNSLARSTELLLLFAIAWAIALASVADGLGFSKEVGAFLAGIALASTPYRATLGARLISIRDFLLLFFFINLGLHVDVTHFGEEFIPALIFSLFILIGKPLMVMGLVGMVGYRKYTVTLTSLSLSQISEFSLILVTLGVSLGHISEQVMGLVTLIGLITMGCSTYMIIYSHHIYEWMSPLLSWLEKNIPMTRKKLADVGTSNLHGVDIILFGLGRYGGSLGLNLHRQGLKVLGVDFNPELVRHWRSEGMLAFYGDAEDPEFAALLPLGEAKWVVSTLVGERVGLILLHTLQHYHYQGKVALTSHTIREMQVLAEAGADLVLLPFRDAAQEAARTLAQL